MKLYFMLVRRVPPVMSPILAEVFAILRGCGFEVDAGIAEEMLQSPDGLSVRHDLYVLKSHTELSLSLAGVLYAQGARVLNPYHCCLTTQNKIVASHHLRAAGVPVPRTWVTGDLSLLRPIVETTPLILKPYLGHRGHGIHVVHSPKQLAAVPPPSVPMLVQEYVSGPGEDLKLYVVGESVFGVRKPFSEESFTLAGQPCSLSDDIRAMALRCGAALGLGLYGLDVIEGPQGPVVVDVNYFPGYKGVPNIAPRIAEYVLEYSRGARCLDLAEGSLATSQCS